MGSNPTLSAKKNAPFAGASLVVNRASNQGGGGGAGQVSTSTSTKRTPNELTSMFPSPAVMAPVVQSTVAVGIS